MGCRTPLAPSVSEGADAGGNSVPNTTVNCDCIAQSSTGLPGRPVDCDSTFQSFTAISHGSSMPRQKSSSTSRVNTAVGCGLKWRGGRGGRTELQHKRYLPGELVHGAATSTA